MRDIHIYVGVLLFERRWQYYGKCSVEEQVTGEHGEVELCCKISCIN
jgi:hypothetical protein